MSGPPGANAGSPPPRWRSTLGAAFTTAHSKRVDGWRRTTRMCARQRVGLVKLGSPMWRPSMLAQMPLTDDEQAAVEDGATAVDRLLDRLRDIPTPAGPTPRDLLAAGNFVPLAQPTTRVIPSPFVEKSVETLDFPFPRKSVRTATLGGLHGDFVTQPFETLEGPTEGCTPVTFVEVVAAEVLVGAAVSDDSVGDDQDGVRDGDERAFVPRLAARRRYCAAR